MTIYILTCINESSELVSCKPYKNLDMAQAMMRVEAEAEAKDFEDNDRPDYGYIGDFSAAVGTEDHGYIWNITEAEL